MGATKTQITNLLEMRYDYQSARNVLNNWRKFAQIKEDVDPMTDTHLVSLLDYLKANAPEACRVHAAVERLILAKDAADAQHDRHSAELNQTPEHAACDPLQNSECAACDPQQNNECAACEPQQNSEWAECEPQHNFECAECEPQCADENAEQAEEQTEQAEDAPTEQADAEPREGGKKKGKKKH